MNILIPLVLVTGIQVFPGKGEASACRKAISIRSLAQELYDVAAYSQLAPHSRRLAYFTRHLQNSARPGVPCQKIEKAFQHVRIAWRDLDLELNSAARDLRKDRRRLRHQFLKLKTAMSAKDIYSSQFFSGEEEMTGRPQG